MKRDLGTFKQRLETAAKKYTGYLQRQAPDVLIFARLLQDETVEKVKKTKANAKHPHGAYIVPVATAVHILGDDWEAQMQRLKVTYEVSPPPRAKILIDGRSLEEDGLLKEPLGFSGAFSGQVGQMQVVAPGNVVKLLNRGDEEAATIELSSRDMKRYFGENLPENLEVSGVRAETKGDALVVDAAQLRKLLEVYHAIHSECLNEAGKNGPPRPQ